MDFSKQIWSGEFSLLLENQRANTFTDFLNPKKIARQYKSRPDLFKNYKESLIVLPIMYRTWIIMIVLATYMI